MLCQRLTTPLGQAVAGRSGAVAEFSGEWFYKPGAADVGVKNFIHYLAYIFKNISPFDELLIIGSAGSNLEGIPPAGVEFSVYPVQCK